MAKKISKTASADHPWKSQEKVPDTDLDQDIFKIASTSQGFGSA